MKGMDKGFLGQTYCLYKVIMNNGCANELGSGQFDIF